MNAEALLAGLRIVAPSVAIAIDHEENIYFERDGDGSDPADEGYIPHDVTVKAMAIIAGRVVIGENTMGGHYVMVGEAPDPEIGGYLPQMIDAALDDLKTNARDAELIRQIDDAAKMIETEMKDRYAEQRATA